MAPSSTSLSRPTQIMHPKPIYVAKPPTSYTSLWNSQRGRSLPSVPSDYRRTVDEPQPVPPKPCTYGSIGDGRPNPSARPGRCPWTTSLILPSSKATSTTSTEDANHGVVGDSPPEQSAEESVSRDTHPSITNGGTSTPLSLQPGDLIYLTTPQGPRYYYGRREVDDNSANYIPMGRLPVAKGVVGYGSHEPSA